MNVASFELCKELYGLSGWATEDRLLHYYAGGFVTGTADNNNPSAYDLGHLLRKLRAIDDPVLTEHKANIYVELTVLENYASATAVRGITETGPAQRIQPRLPICDADTPEDAACKLAIELIKQGVLKP